MADACAHVAQRLSLSVFTNLCRFKKKINMVLYFLNVGVSQRKKTLADVQPSVSGLGLGSKQHRRTALLGKTLQGSAQLC